MFLVAMTNGIHWLHVVMDATIDYVGWQHMTLNPS
jgi:hypothetical protein